MSGELDSAISNLSEHTKKIEIATYYCFGDADKAKQMVAGTYKDLYAIKGRFTSATLQGAFLCFVNFRANFFQSIYTVVTRTFLPGDMKTNQEWRFFEQQIAIARAQSDYDQSSHVQFDESFAAGITYDLIKDLGVLVEQNDQVAINHLFHRFFQGGLSLSNVNVSVDVEVASSLEMELISTSSKKIDPAKLQKDRENADKNEEATEEPQPNLTDEALAGKEIRLLLHGSLVLSPIKGVEIYTLKEGDRVLMNIHDTHNKAVQVAKAFGAYDDGRMKPIPCRLISAVHHREGGFHFVAVVAKGIFATIDEEEENIRVAVESSSYQKELEAATSHTRIVILLALFGAVLVGLIATIVILLK